ncbi:MAG: glycosyltransferase family 4 protein [Opitutaceae bacterium]
MEHKPQPKILLSNQSTTYLFRSLCDRVAKDFPEADVCLLAGACELEAGQQPQFTHINTIEFVRSPGWKRIWTWSVYTLRFLWLILSRRWDLVVVTTNPPLCAWVMGLVARLLHRPYLLIQYDIYPDVLARMGGLSPQSFIYRMLERLSACSMRNASAVVTLADDMAERLREHGIDDEMPLHIIPNWADTTVYCPEPKESNHFAQEHDLIGKFVVMYSGAFGATHDIDSMLKAAELLSDLPDVLLLLVGKGTRQHEIEAEVKRLGASNVKLLPWQPLEAVPLSLAAADCHIVTLDAPYAGISFPSKFYTSISVGAAIMAIASEETALGQTVRDSEIGYVIPPGKPEKMAEAIRELHSDPQRALDMRQRSRQLAEDYYDEAYCTGQYVDLIKDIFSRNGANKNER